MLKPLLLSALPLCLLAQEQQNPFEWLKEGETIQAEQTGFKPVERKSAAMWSSRHPLNYQCFETMQRSYDGEHVDTITAVVSFESGVEEYSDTRRNGKPIKNIRRLNGAWNMGEFSGWSQNPQSWPLESRGKIYTLDYTTSVEGDSVVRRTTGDGLPKDIAWIEWGIVYGPNSDIPQTGWYKVLGRNGGTYLNEMTWTGCREYRAESRLIVEEQ